MTEDFRKFNEQYEVSNLGNVKKDGQLIKPCSGKKYDYVTYKGKMLRIHEMVGKCFPEICGENDSRLHLHHINGNSKDNRAENLIRITPEDHKKLHQEENDISVPVKAYDLDGKYVGRWDSKTQAAKDMDVDYRHISEMVNNTPGRHSAGGFVWFREDATPEEVAEKLMVVATRAKRRKEQEEQARVKRELRKKRLQENMRILQEKKEGKKVLEYDEFGYLLKEWEDTKEVVKYYGVAYSTITNNINGKTEFVKVNGKKRYYIKKKYMPVLEKK